MREIVCWLDAPANGRVTMVQDRFGKVYRAFGGDRKIGDVLEVSDLRKVTNNGQTELVHVLFCKIIARVDGRAVAAKIRGKGRRLREKMSWYEIHAD